MTAYLFAKGPSLDRWRAAFAAGEVELPRDALLCAVNDVPVAEAAIFKNRRRFRYTFAADHVHRFGAQLPRTVTLVMPRAILDETPPLPCATIAADPGLYRGSIILAASWLRAHHGIRRLICIGIDGGLARSDALEWPGGETLVPGSYSVIRGLFVAWCWHHGIALEFYGLPASTASGLQSIRIIRETCIAGIAFTPGSCVAVPPELALPLVGERRAVLSPIPAEQLVFAAA